MNVFQKLWSYGVVYPLAQLYRLTAQNLFDVLGNSWWYFKLGLDGAWDETSDLLCAQREHICLIAEMLDPIEMIGDVVSNSTYGFDGIVDDVPILDRWPTWTQTARVHVYRGRLGNCQDHMHFAKWSMRFLNSQHAKSKRWKIRKNIYTPIHPFYTITKTHYFLSVLSPNGVEYQMSNGKVTQESRDAVATRLLRGEHKYIWLTSESWSE